MTDLLARDWGGVVTVAAYVVVSLIAVVLVLRVRTRGARFRRLARREKLHWMGALGTLPRAWGDLACLHAGGKGRTLNCVAGERAGRAIALVDHHCAVPPLSGPEARAHMSMLLTGLAYWYLLPLIDDTRDPGFSAAVVECELPEGVSTVEAKRALAPWRVEFGREASVIRTDDGYCAPDELLRALDRLNDTLDVLASPAAPRAR